MLRNFSTHSSTCINNAKWDENKKKKKEKKTDRDKYIMEVKTPFSHPKIEWTTKTTYHSLHHANYFYLSVCCVISTQMPRFFSLHPSLSLDLLLACSVSLSLLLSRVKWQSVFCSSDEMFFIEAKKKDSIIGRETDNGNGSSFDTTKRRKQKKNLNKRRMRNSIKCLVWHWIQSIGYHSSASKPSRWNSQNVIGYGRSPFVRRSIRISNTEQANGGWQQSNLLLFYHHYLANMLCLCQLMLRLSLRAMRYLFAD